MTDDEEYISACMERMRTVLPLSHGTASRARILGDPNFFSTFSRLCEVMHEKYPDITCSTEPGISSITAFASVAGIALSDGFTVSDGASRRSGSS